jgi:hypothetical protein
MSMFDISEGAANGIYSVSNALLIIGAALALVGTLGAIWSGGVRERFFDTKISKNQSDTAKANVEAARANERANEASLKLEELRRQTAPRQLNRDAFFKAIDGKPKALTKIMYVRDDPECFDVAQQIYRVLKDAKWDAISPVPIPSNDPNLRPDIPIAMSVGGQPSGVSVIAHSVSDEEAEAGKNISFGRDWKVTPWTALSNAVLESLGRVGGGGGGATAPPEGELRIVVAPRM